jgi:hypothetical protein
MGRRVADGGTGSVSGEVLVISPYYSWREYVALTAGQGGDFVLAWQQAEAAPVPDIFVQGVDSQGQASGSVLNLTGHGAAQERPDLDRGQNGYLVVWQDGRNGAGSDSDIYGHLLAGSGALSGTLITITTAAGDQLDPAVAYNSRRDEYLVVWSDYRNGGSADLYGQLVRSDGSLGASPVLTISLASSSQKMVDVVYNPDREEYLAVWQDYRNGPYDIYGQVISGGGGLVGSELAIATAPNIQDVPELAYSPAPGPGAEGLYLVVWEAGRDGAQDPTYGPLVRAGCGGGWGRPSRPVPGGLGGPPPWVGRGHLRPAGGAVAGRPVVG